jgi:hypothetical protein
MNVKAPQPTTDPTNVVEAARSCRTIFELCKRIAERKNTELFRQQIGLAES